MTVGELIAAIKDYPQDAVVNIDEDKEVGLIEYVDYSLVENNESNDRVVYINTRQEEF